MNPDVDDKVIFFLANNFQHIGHFNGIRSMWISLCYVIEDEYVYRFSHVLHWNGLVPVYAHGTWADTL